MRTSIVGFEGNSYFNFLERICLLSFFFEISSLQKMIIIRAPYSLRDRLMLVIKSDRGMIKGHPVLNGIEKIH